MSFITKYFTNQFGYNEEELIEKIINFIHKNDVDNLLKHIEETFIEKLNIPEIYSRGQYEILEILINHKLNPSEAMEQLCSTPGSEKADIILKQIHMFNFLMKNGAQLNNNLVFKACEAKNIHIIRELIRQDIPINYRIEYPNYIFSRPSVHIKKSISCINLSSLA